MIGGKSGGRAAFLTALLLGGAIVPAGAATGPQAYPAPGGMRHNDDFTVRVRSSGADWVDLFEHDVIVDLDAPQHATMVQFDMDGPVEVEVRRNNGDVHSVVARPARAGVVPVLAGNVARFRLTRPAKLSIEFDGDRLHNLHLFASAAGAAPTVPAGRSVVRFAPGIHVPPDQPGAVFAFPSHTTVLLEPGAVLRGKIALDRVTDVQILGHGIIDQPERGFEITYSSDITIDGPTVINPKHYTVFCGQSDHIAIHDLNTFSAAPWSDGIDMMSCADVRVDNVFLRTSDDSVAIYGHRWNFAGDARNITVSDAVLWADVAHPINIGLHGGGETAPEVIENIAFRRIDVLEHDEDDPEYRGVMAISDGDANVVRHVSFDDIAVEHVQEGSLLNFRVLFNQKYSLAPGRGISDVTVRNVRVSNAASLSPSQIAGFDAARTIRGVTISGLTLDGRAMTSAAQADIRVGPFADGVVVIPAPASKPRPSGAHHRRWRKRPRVRFCRWCTCHRAGNA
jgi:hypothetical protein